MTLTWERLKARLWPPVDPGPQVEIAADSVYRQPEFFTVRCPLCGAAVNVIAEDERGWLTIAPHEQVDTRSRQEPWFQNAYVTYCSAGGRAFPVEAGPASDARSNC